MPPQRSLEDDLGLSCYIHLPWTHQGPQLLAETVYVHHIQEPACVCYAFWHADILLGSGITASTCHKQYLLLCAACAATCTAGSTASRLGLLLQHCQHPVSRLSLHGRATPWAARLCREKHFVTGIVAANPICCHSFAVNPICSQLLSFRSQAATANRNSKTDNVPPSYNAVHSRIKILVSRIPRDLCEQEAVAGPVIGCRSV